VPEYDSFARFYDALADRMTDDIPLFIEQAQAANGPALELACGTGRVLLPLARAGIDITGIDICQPMLDKLQAKLEQEPRDVQARVALKCADMRSYRFSSKFKYVFCAFNSFLHLLTTDDQLTCLESVRSYLAPDGRLCISVFAPFHDRLAKRVEFEEELRDVRTLARYYTRRNLAEQTQVSTLIYENTDGENLVHRQATDFTLCWIHNREMHLLLRLAGFDVETVYGGFDKRPYDYVSGGQVFVARPRPS
jgi:SAM-dependent methyltransferase